jgi:hypothetical protein
MSTKLILPALAAFLTVLSLQGTAHARGNSSAANDYTGSRTKAHAFTHGTSCPIRHRRTSPKCRFKQTIKRLKAKAPSDAFGSIGYRVGTPVGRSSTDVWSGVFFVGRDPDPNIRFQLLRDFR